MRQRLNLDSLLDKYEKNYGLSPPNPIPSKQLQRVKSEGKLRNEVFQGMTEKNFFEGIIKNNSHYHQQIIHNSNRNSEQNFHMSKSECQKYLLKIKGDLKKEQDLINSQLEIFYSKIVERYQKEHHDLRNQLLNLLQNSLQISKRSFLEKLHRERGKIIPQHHQSAKNAISSINIEINNLLKALQSSNYRQTIADVVTRDFSKMLSSIKKSRINWEKRGIGQISINRQKINNIQQNLQGICQWRGSFKEEEYKKVDDLVLTIPGREEMANSRRSRIFEVFQSRGHALTQREASERSQKKPMRNTFFDFDQD